MATKLTHAQKVFNATVDGQKTLMATSMGLHADAYISHTIVNVPGADYGADPMGDGTFRMVPSGDIVDYAERVRRLPPRK